MIADMNYEMYMFGSTCWNMAYRRLPEEVLQDEEGITNMKNLGENMAHLLLKLND